MGKCQWLIGLAPFDQTETTHSLPISFLTLNVVVNVLGDLEPYNGVGAYTVHNKYLDSVILYGDYSANHTTDNTMANIFVIGY